MMTFLNMSEHSNNITAGDFNGDLLYPLMREITGLFMFPIACLIGIPAYIVATYILMQSKRWSFSVSFLFALAIVELLILINDLLYFIYVFLCRTYPEFGEKMFGSVFPCAHYLKAVASTWEAWIIVFIAAERYILVHKATTAKLICTQRRAFVICTFIVIASFLTSVPYAMKYAKSAKGPTNETANDVVINHIWHNEKFAIIFNGLHHAVRSGIPILLLLCLNAFVLSVLQKQQSNIKKRRASILLVISIFAFVACHLPDSIMSTVFQSDFYEASDKVKGLREITDCLILLNTNINFAIYFICNKKFVLSFRKICHLRTKAVSRPERLQMVALR